MSQRLRAAQHPDSRSVNLHVHLALFAVRVVLFAWPVTRPLSAGCFFVVPDSALCHHSE